MSAPLDREGRDDGADFQREIVIRLIAGRWWIIVSTVLVSALFAAFALVMTPVYRASTVLVPGSSDHGVMGSALGSAIGSLGGLASLAGINVPSGSSATDEALAVLRSRQFTERFIADNNVMPDLYPEKWDAKSKQWLGGRDRAPTPAQAFRYFDRRVRSVAWDKKTGLITLQVDHADRVKAAIWANDLVQRLNAEMRARAISKADASLGYLEKELAATSVVETREAINRLIEAQINQRMLADVTDEYAFRVVDRAMPPDADDMVQPKRSLLFAAGPIIGLSIGAILAMLRKSRWSARQNGGVARGFDDA